ncbi:unnamed protein product [Phytomonas sp. Hart1]|nr:unnamed protein product [Phytomonas sp. Hart1]|eukprot:CCW72041.1 unnamed protein product [Phytomonas sp. isolate Hart1]
MLETQSLRAQINALASEITKEKKLSGASSDKCKALINEMNNLRAKLPKDDKKTKEKCIEPTYFESRLDMVTKMGIMGSAYPHKFEQQFTIPEFKNKYAPQLKEPGEKINEIVSITGRIITKRSSGSKLHFINIQGDMSVVQIISSVTDYTDPDEFNLIHSRIKRGDIIGVEGFPSLSKTNEFSLSATKVTLLSTCFHMLPDEYFGLSSIEQRFRQRYLDLIANRDNIKNFITRSRIIQYMRKFFQERNFIEVETPVLNQIAGGAAARPFVTHHNDLNEKMYLRIAPELYLKELIVGGMDRVFELGKQFRNEGIDLTHNPEFTSVEAYWAYHDYNDWMSTTEDLLYSLAMEIHGSPLVKYTPKDSEGRPLPELTLNFNKPFKRLYIIPELERRLNISFETVDFEADETITFLINLCKKHNIEPIPPYTVPRLLDTLIAEFLEPECLDPCFICDHPRVMSPLAKWHRADTRLGERFELFVNKKELVNAYTELNNPIVQREEFQKQLRNRDKGDDESMQIDENFITALEYGLPPTGGWGLGIDRLVMLLTSQSNIKEVLLFPAMKSAEKDTLSYPPGTLLNGQGVPLI